MVAFQSTFTTMTIARHLAIFLCLMMATTAMDAMPQGDKTGSSFQSPDNTNVAVADLLGSDPMPKISPYPPRFSQVDAAAVALGGNNGNILSADAESGDSRALLGKLLLSLLEQHKKMPANWILHRAMLSGQHKRQIRYQQCYFNPISCF